MFIQCSFIHSLTKYRAPSRLRKTEEQADHMDSVLQSFLTDWGEETSLEDETKCKATCVKSERKHQRMVSLSGEEAQEWSQWNRFNSSVHWERELLEPLMCLNSKPIYEVLLSLTSRQQASNAYGAPTLYQVLAWCQGKSCGQTDKLSALVGAHAHISKNSK